jgi:DNA-binding protein HU-beta
MTKTEIVDHIANAAGIKKVQSAVALNALTQLVTETVARGDRIGFPGLGTFERTHRPARAGRNVATGEAIDIAEKFAPKFKAAKQFKDAMPDPAPAKKAAVKAAKK